MTQSTSILYARKHAIEQFNAIRIRAVLDSWLSKILMKHNGLKSLVGSKVTGLNGKRLSRTQRIRVDKIVGTIRYSDDFDQNFRPLNQQSQIRWVQALLQLDQDQWQPIVVHKVGESYYVANGLHQVSVARYAGMKFIEAEVWDHSSCRLAQGDRTSMRKVQRQCEESFSTN